MHPSAVNLWAQYRKLDPSAPEAPPAVFYFCDNEKDADICADLVRRGIKRATACSLAELELAGGSIPKPGDLALVTNWAGIGAAVIRTTRVDIKRFADVDEDFAAAEGEGDQSLEWWRQAHEAYYRRVLKESDYTFSSDLLIACERFETVLVAVS